MVFRQDQADGGGEEAAVATERSRGFPHSGFGISAKRLFTFNQVSFTAFNSKSWAVLENK